MDIKTSIADTRKGFEESFASGDFYNRQTQDGEHLEKILAFISVREGMRILDLGCGSGYLSFPIAENNPQCEVTGLDIVSVALEVNRSRAEEKGLDNLTFVSYDGMDFPFEAGTFDLVVSRYALHHFPDIEHSIGEVGRVLKAGGVLFISDPCPNDCDAERFVDDFMRMKKDGHIRFYTKNEWAEICGKCGLQMSDSFESTIRFPKKKDTAIGYEDVLKKHDKAVIDSYDLEETDTELFITERVNNILFRRYYKKIDKDSYYRKGVFRHFTEDCKCSTSMTARVDVTKLVQYSKESGTKFYVNFLYLLSKVLNSRDDYRMGYLWQSEELICYDVINPAQYVFHEDTETCTPVYTKYDPDYEVFYRNAVADIEKAKQTNEYGLDMENHPNWFDASFISWLSYDSLNIELPDGFLYFLPIINWGKYREEGGKLMMPLSVRMNHAVADGFLVANVFRLLEKEMDAFGR